jgi:phasin
MQDARMPENFQAFAQDSVAKSREAYSKIAAVAADQAKAVESVATEAQVSARTLGERALTNLTRNTEAAFDAAEALAKAKSLPEAAKLQADFVQSQFAAMGAQTKEFFELSTKMAQQTFETFGSVATKGFEQSKSFGQPAAAAFAQPAFTPAKGKR